MKNNSQLSAVNSQLPNGWEIKKLGEVCEVIAGQSPESKFYNNKGEGLAFYQGKKEFTEKFIGEPTKWTTKITKEAEKGDILMSVRAPVGPVNFSTQKICIGRGLAAIRCSKLVEKEYVFNFLKKYEDEITGNTGAVFNSINKSQIGAIEIPIPPLPEQKRIVSILDRAFEAIDKAKANAEQNLKNAKELFESYLQGVFENKGDDWVEKSLGDLGEVQTGTTPPTKDKSNYGSFISFAKPPHFKSDGSIDTGTSMLSEDGLKKGRLFKSNSILMVCIGATIGKTGFSKNPITANQQINALTPNNNYEPKILYYALISQHVQKQIMEVGRSAQATLPIINKTKWSKLKINVPKNKQLQIKIINNLDKLKINSQKLEAIYQQKIDNLEELKKSVLQKAFNGKLTIDN